MYDNYNVLNSNVLLLSTLLAIGIFGIFCYLHDNKMLDMVDSVVSSVLFFYRLNGYNFKVLSRFGKYSLYLYIIHPVALNLLRMFYIKLNIDNIYVWMISLLFVGIGIPYIYSVLVQKFALLEICFIHESILKSIVKKENSKYDD